jgi:hypothetical protein
MIESFQPLTGIVCFVCREYAPYNNNFIPKDDHNILSSSPKLFILKKISNRQYQGLRRYIKDICTKSISAGHLEL